MLMVVSGWVVAKSGISLWVFQGHCAVLVQYFSTHIILFESYFLLLSVCLARIISSLLFLFCFVPYGPLPPSLLL